MTSPVTPQSVTRGGGEALLVPAEKNEALEPKRTNVTARCTNTHHSFEKCDVVGLTSVPGLCVECFPKDLGGKYHFLSDY